MISIRLKALRQSMVQQGIHAYIVASSDPHISEYLPMYWQGREWLSGFTGSVGTLVVSEAFAGLWVDSRYFEQADVELAGSGIQVMRMQASSDYPTYNDWLCDQLPQGSSVGVDGDTLAYGATQILKKQLSAKNISLRTDLDLLLGIWKDRPRLPTQAIYEHTLDKACVSREQKIEQVRRRIQALGGDWHFISSLDDIAWLLNLRGSDVSYNPVFLAHLLMSDHEVSLFVDPSKLSPELTQVLKTDGVLVRPYGEAKQGLRQIPASQTLVYDPARISAGFVYEIPSDVAVIEHINPSTLMKSCKTSEQIEHVRRVMEYDGAALCEFFSWFEGALQRGLPITELTIDEKITQARARQPGFVCPSFATIAGFNKNGALPHYRATEQAHAPIEGSGLLLIDSGGQYLGGTTDITRVVPVGTPTAEQKRDYTLVLKGTMALSRARFPKGIRSVMLDAIARTPLWAEGLDYGHGTGHGVGYFLNVHEGPQTISNGGVVTPHMAMLEGMITSVEPGLYRPQQWGIRIENLVVTIPIQKNEFGDFLGFETLTLCPIDTRCIDTRLLSNDEIKWLNDYHEMVKARLSPLVQGEAQDWLMERTKPLALHH